MLLRTQDAHLLSPGVDNDTRNTYIRRLAGLLVPMNPEAKPRSLLEETGARSPTTRCIGCRGHTADVTGLGYCQDCLSRKYPGLRIDQLLDLLEGPAIPVEEPEDPD